MKSLKEKFNNGSVTITSVAGWGLALLTTLTGLFVTQVSATNTKVNKLEVDLTRVDTSTTIELKEINRKLDVLIEKENKEGLLVKKE